MNNYSIADLLDDFSIRRLFDIFRNENKEVRLVGGCIRDIFLRKKTKDIDFAANIKPGEIINILNKNKIQYEDFAYKYGSITAILENQKYQITALREDINQMGRHTNIKYTNNWKQDAQRRDFTINALYLSGDGNLTDYFNGQKDLADSKLKFIGNVDERIQEDYLRIFRYYRFLGLFENPILIEGYEEILSQNVDKSFDYLSNDLIRKEILKMFSTSFPINCFFNKKKPKDKKYWIKLVKKEFVKSNYDIGLNKCLNNIELIIN